MPLWVKFQYHFGGGPGLPGPPLAAPLFTKVNKIKKGDEASDMSGSCDSIVSVY